MLIKEYGIGAIAESVETWASRSEWEAEQTPMKEPGGQPMYLGPGFIAMLNGTCETVDLVTIQLTGTQFYLARIKGRLHHRGRSLPRRQRGSVAGALKRAPGVPYCSVPLLEIH